MGKLTVEANGKTSPEDPPPYPLEPLPTKPGLQTNIVVPEAEPGHPPNINTRLWNFLFCICTLLECWNEQDITLVTVCVVLVALVILGVKLAKKCKMARKHGCSDSGEEGRMEDGDCEEMTVEANGKTSPEDPPSYPLEPLPTKPGLQTNMVVPEAVPGHPPNIITRLWDYPFCIFPLLECWKKRNIALVTVCVVLVVALVILGVKLAIKHKMAGKHGWIDSGEEGRMGDDDCEEMEDIDEMGDEGPQSDEQDGDRVNSRWCIDKTCP